MPENVLKIPRTAQNRLHLKLQDGFVGLSWTKVQEISASAKLQAARVYSLAVLDAAMRSLVERWPGSKELQHKPSKNAVEELQSTNAWEVVYWALHRGNRALGELEGLFETQVDLGLEQAEVLADAEGLDEVEGERLLELLSEPIRLHDDLDAQIAYVLKRWGKYLDPSLKEQLLRSRDYLREAWVGHFGPGASAQAPDFSSLYQHQERFTHDRDWMPSVVLIAKNIYVWLHQLSATYGYRIERLDEVPEAELARLRSQGITGLWMIGLWERSPASRRIKELCGRPDAVASAYSLYDYRIAGALGGEEALESLRQRAASHGVRLAADMVPNHMGITSEWVKNNPEWFLSVDHPPFPSYSFHGENLSHEPEFGVQIEDHYYDQTDAAVVFKHMDHRTGQTRYIYHGNDGTSFPWNDTAQLDFLNPDAREAVIRTIIDVARKFPIIRFDAAMTLVRKHVQRLWYPPPGHGGAIPSRSQFGVSQEEFDRRMPMEFWQEVVDRIQAEAPDTLLLAEAFWMLEGYFVRTLGMHRVYNSAFMHMLRDEDNAGYRKLMRDTLAFDPEVLKRYVNFMNNPDEDTAVNQFGKGDKYFGVAVLMATMPGLPMLGHGQLEGFTEKYGMDFRRPLLNEPPDKGLLAHHERVLIPLLHRRRLFAEVAHFALFDVFNPQGGLEQNVFAYSNMLPNEHGLERALVIYHNRYAEVRGYVDRAVSESGGRLVDHLQLPAWGVVRFRDQISGEWFLRTAESLHRHGLYVELGAYTCHVFLDWGFEEGKEWFELESHLQGRSTPSLDHEFILMRYGASRTALAWLLDSDLKDSEALKREFETLSQSILNYWPDAELTELPALEGHSPEARLVILVEWLEESGASGVWERMALEELTPFGSLVRAALDIDSLDVSSWPLLESVQEALSVHEFEGTRYFEAQKAERFLKKMPELLQATRRFCGTDRTALGGAIAEFEEALEEANYDFDRVHFDG